MLRVGILVSGGGTNLQAILDRLDDGSLTNVSVEVVIRITAVLTRWNGRRTMESRLRPSLRRSSEPGRNLTRHFCQRWTSTISI